MIETLMPEDAFIWTLIVMMLASLIVMGLLFYGRYTRKKKDVAKAALKKYEETDVFVEPKMRFDPAVTVSWLGGSFLNVLFSLGLLMTVVMYTDISSGPSIVYVLVGFAISFFVAVPMYLMTEFMANGVLDAKAVKNMVRRIIGSDDTKKMIGLVCTKLGIMDAAAIERICEKLRNSISASEYSDLTPDEMLLISKAVSDNEHGVL
jgi:hypothetical protein